ncbi:hypothetical protein [Limnospira platensis]|uniref:hypothetical protein n=1 Tax=Limnospira platensis TaxID=118562 RepID=UPI0001D0EB25|nr:hypothetical protein AP285_16200 [Arthrospira platensis YZ]KDR57652.1 hypothetical protein APPUASWS_009680 [Arthrospira platensis str. Paraca]MDF2213161.1 hypothetical protein [Arthrospira platensis NCB002]QQW27145.1 hypothetical protein AP9108_17620 [Arthrospira sp. PCC 9108]BAI91502.1 hypothetical protein NIES39_J04550 [Arthrospira platensis NIES-39]
MNSKEQGNYTVTKSIEGNVTVENVTNVNTNKVLTPTEYIETLSRFKQFTKFLELVNTYLPYPKTSLIQSLTNKLQTSEIINSNTFYLTYSEIATLKRVTNAILTLLKAGGVKLPRKVTGAIQDDINALEDHLLGSESDLEDEDNEVNPFSSWLD